MGTASDLKKIVDEQQAQLKNQVVQQVQDLEQMARDLVGDLPEESENVIASTSDEPLSEIHSTPQDTPAAINQDPVILANPTPQKVTKSIEKILSDLKSSIDNELKNEVYQSPAYASVVKAGTAVSSSIHNLLQLSQNKKDQGIKGEDTDIKTAFNDFKTTLKNNQRTMETAPGLWNKIKSYINVIHQWLWRTDYELTTVKKTGLSHSLFAYKQDREQYQAVKAAQEAPSMKQG